MLRFAILQSNSSSTVTRLKRRRARKAKPVIQQVDELKDKPKND